MTSNDAATPVAGNPTTRRAFLAAASAAALGGVAVAWGRGPHASGPSAVAPTSGRPLAARVPTRLDTPASALAPAVRVPPTTLPPPPRGRILFPMEPGRQCIVLDNFGDCRPIGACSRRHEGVDILGELGLDCYAVDNAVVTRMEDGPNSGLMINIEAADGTYYSYQHLSAFAEGLEIGSVVGRGQVIGYVGDTGNPGTGNFHLHFEWHPVSAGGAARDPYDRLMIPDSCTTYSDQD